ncbi:hypothetical protein CK204_27115, partial [Klebsiella pneumoniae]
MIVGLLLFILRPLLLARWLAFFLMIVRSLNFSQSIFYWGIVFLLGWFDSFAAVLWRREFRMAVAGAGLLAWRKARWVRAIHCFDSDSNERATHFISGIN